MHSLIKDLNELRPLFSKQDKLRYLLLLLLMFGASFLEAISVGAVPLFISLLQKPAKFAEAPLIGQLISNFSDKPSPKVILISSFLLVTFIVLKNLFLTFVFFMQSKIVIRQGIQLRERMFKTYQAAPYEWHLQHSSAEMLRNIQQDTAAILNSVLMPCLDLIMSFVMSVFIVFTIVVSTPGRVILGLAVTATGLFLLVRTFRGRMYRYGKVVRAEERTMIQSIQQGFGALAEARIIGCEDYLSNAYGKSAMRQGRVVRKQIIIRKSTPYFIEMTAIVGLLLILFLLLQVGGSLQAILPQMTLLAVATMRLKQMAIKIASSTNVINSGRAYIPGIMRDVRELDAIQKMSQQRRTNSQKIGQFERLTLSNVTYTYPGANRPSINNISLKLKRGESIAFVGETGSGKSTLANLVMGLLEPQAGQIVVNGVDINSDVSGWRTHIGYIPQSIFLIDDTILANVAFGIPEQAVDKARLWGALRSARLDDYIQGLPQGIHTQVGERGVRLSGGQRQRLGIARAIYFDPDVLVMDEATSALDNKTETEVMEALENLKQNRTIIMIAHRLSTVESCDRLYFLKNGHLVVEGAFDSLQADSVDFREMVLAGRRSL